MPRTVHIPHLHKSLCPLAGLYSAGVWLRNKLFDMGILPVEEFSIPIISVGNLTVGGTGKTPLIEYLIESISPHMQVAVLSRGYRRKSRGFVIADDTSSAQILGDEPYQIYKKYPHVIVAVDSNRRRGIKHLLQLDNKPHVVLLDDAHQHRYVQPSLSIVLCDYNRPIYNDLPLPAGRLREPMYALNRADIVILTKCNHTLSHEEIKEEAQLLNFDANKIYASHIQYDPLQSLHTSTRHRIDDIITPNHHAVLLTGIANPQPIHNYIYNYTQHITTLSYPDHHYFTQDDIKNISQAISGNNTIIITTEKDAARLREVAIPEQIQQMCYILPMRTVIQQSHRQQPFDLFIKGVIGNE